MTHPAPSRPDTLRVWLTAIRPKTLFAAFTPVLLGSAFAWTDGLFHLLAALAALTGALLIQIGTNFSNDYVDFLKGADTGERVGPLRVTQAGWVSPATMRLATIAAFGLAFASGLYLIWRGGWVVLLIGVVSIAAGVAYTAGKKALAYTGLGDVAAFLFFGPVAVAGTYYVQALGVTGPVLLAGFGPGFLSMALLLINNVRDVAQDAPAGKRTLVVRFGREFGVRLYGLTLIGAALIPVILVFWEGRHLGAVAAVPALLPGFRAWQTLKMHTSPEYLNPLLGLTAQMGLFYGIAFSLGWLLS